jgi:hypothetical protein
MPADLYSFRRTVLEIATDLPNGRTTSRELGLGLGSTRAEPVVMRTAGIGLTASP